MAPARRRGSASRASSKATAASASVNADTAILADAKGPTSDKLVVRRVAQPGEGFERQADLLQVGIGRIDEFQPAEGMHLIARRERETPALQHAEHFVQQRVVRPAHAGSPVGSLDPAASSRATSSKSLPSMIVID